MLDLSERRGQGSGYTEVGSRPLALGCATSSLAFDPSDTRQSVELVKDLVAIENSGGGVIVVGHEATVMPAGPMSPWSYRSTLPR